VVAYIGTASKDRRIFFKWIASWLKKAGAAAVHLAALVSPRADLDAARNTLQAADLIFVSGGDVALGMKYLERGGMISYLQQLHRAGKSFLGLSAGSIMLARNWVRWTDPDDDASAEVFPCMGLAPFVCDTHAEKENWKELKILITLSKPDVAYGIPSGASLQIAADGSLTALGKPVQRFKFQQGRIVRGEDLSSS
jgi:peptidase E